MLNIYVANSLFSESDRQYNEYIYESLVNAGLGSKKNIYVPQHNAEINDKSNYADSKMILEGDNARLVNSDVLLVVLDNADDSGVSAEIGYFKALAEQDPSKKIVGIYSDRRHGRQDRLDKNNPKIKALKEIGENQFHYINLYTIGAVKSAGVVVESVSEAVTAIEKILGGRSKVKTLTGKENGYRDIMTHYKEVIQNYNGKEQIEVIIPAGIKEVSTSYVTGAIDAIEEVFSGDELFITKMFEFKGDAKAILDIKKALYITGY